MSLTLHQYPAGDVAAPKQLVIMLHGYGADGADLLGLAPYLAANWPDAVFMAPDAPSKCEMGGAGYQWFSLSDWTPAQMLAGVESAVPILNAFIDEQINKYRLHPRNVVLLGFSQGAMLALICCLAAQSGFGRGDQLCGHVD